MVVSTKPKEWIRTQMAATSKVAKAIKSGALVRQPCEVCGAEKVDAHHDDYSKPLDVRWLCRKHHLHHHRGAGSGVCLRGHVRAEVGVYTFPDGREWCRACKREAKRREDAKARAQHQPAAQTNGSPS